MPKITGFLHAENDASHIERALESLKVCDELIVIDEGSKDETEKLARSFGATVKKAISGVSTGAYVMDGRHDWVLVLRPNEELNEELIETLENWKQADHEESGFAFEVAERKGEDGWCKHVAEMRLVNRKKINWVGELPPNNTMALKLPGDILRYPE